MAVAQCPGHRCVPGVQKVSKVEDSCAAPNAVLSDTQMQNLEAAAPVGATGGNRYSQAHSIKLAAE